MKKRYFLILMVVLGLGAVIALIYYQNRFKRDFDNNIINTESWALYNYGQIIKESQGISGIDINIINAWDVSKGSQDVIVGVVDSGVDISAGSLSKRIWFNKEEKPNNGKDDDKNGYVDDYYGWDFYNEDATIYDDYLYDYHGTYIANIINEIAPNIQIISSKFLRGTEGDASDSVKAIQYAIDNGASIINCSWCFANEESELYELMKLNEDVLFVCAAGNSRLNLDASPIYPASYNLDNVISIMAIDNTGNAYDISGYGATVDIAAPGKDIFVTLPENDQTFVSGTSAATAFVTGVAGLMKSTNVELTPAEIKKILIKTTKKLDGLSSLCESEGCLDAYKALQECK